MVITALWLCTDLSILIHVQSCINIHYSTYKIITSLWMWTDFKTREYYSIPLLQWNTSFTNRLKWRHPNTNDTYLPRVSQHTCRFNCIILILGVEKRFDCLSFHSFATLNFSLWSFAAKPTLNVCTCCWVLLSRFSSPVMLNPIRNSDKYLL